MLPKSRVLATRFNQLKRNDENVVAHGLCLLMAAYVEFQHALVFLALYNSFQQTQ
ncbi:hypothetical protein MPB2EB_1038 [Mycoavidus sp. B2-EB]|nr:hypothetical protein MPB2EB_1038 [Mycoavidus sp. B2-EB]